MKYPGRVRFAPHKTDVNVDSEPKCVKQVAPTLSRPRFTSRFMWLEQILLSTFRPPLTRTDI